jgi:hypothetical protein
VPIGVNQVLIHGTEDEVVPVELSQQHAAVARAAGDEIGEFWLEGTGHFELISPWTGTWPVVHGAVVQAAFSKNNES